MRRRSRRGVAALAALAALAAACAPAGAHRPAPAPAPASAPASAPAAVAAAPAVADRLFLGRAVGDTAEVTDAQWGAFVRDVVAPLLPDGLTVWRAEGRWRDPGGHVVREPVLVVEVVHAGDARVDAALEEIARAYRRRFAQQAVLRTTTPVAVRVYDGAAGAAATHAP